MLLIGTKLENSLSERSISKDKILKNSICMKCSKQANLQIASRLAVASCWQEWEKRRMKDEGCRVPSGGDENVLESVMLDEQL